MDVTIAKLRTLKSLVNDVSRTSIGGVGRVNAGVNVGVNYGASGRPSHFSELPQYLIATQLGAIARQNSLSNGPLALGPLAIGPGISKNYPGGGVALQSGKSYSLAELKKVMEAAQGTVTTPHIPIKPTLTHTHPDVVGYNLKSAGASMGIIPPGMRVLYNMMGLGGGGSGINRTEKEKEAFYASLKGLPMEEKLRRVKEFQGGRLGSSHADIQQKMQSETEFLRKKGTGGSSTGILSPGQRLLFEWMSKNKSATGFESIKTAGKVVQTATPETVEFRELVKTLRGILNQPDIKGNAAQFNLKAKAAAELRRLGMVGNDPLREYGFKITPPGMNRLFNMFDKLFKGAPNFMGHIAIGPDSMGMNLFSPGQGMDKIGNWIRRLLGGVQEVVEQ